MDKTKEVFKRGYHPKNEQGSIRTKVGGLVGRGNKDESTKATDHVARPLTSLKDPSAFGPPPKKAIYHGDAALSSTTTPARRGLGAPVSKEEPSNTYANQAPAKPSPPPTPFRADRTGLNTSFRPPPRAATLDLSDGKPKPRLPPRLPPRQNSQPSAAASSPPPPYTEIAGLVAGDDGSTKGQAITNTARSGVSVSGFGTRPPPKPAAPAPAQDDKPAPEAVSSIGFLNKHAANRLAKPTAPCPPPQDDNPWREQVSPSTPSPSLGGLSSRFGSLSTSTAPSPNAGKGTTFGQKQAALNTASQLQREPTKVNVADAREAANTANNFRERHGEEVAKGFKVGQGMNKRFGLADKIQVYAGNAGQSAGGAHSETGAAAGAAEQPNPWAGVSSAADGFKKAPPPPPPMKSPTSPPPVPFGSKPR